MINTEDEVCYDLRSSCTEEEAVAMMLGWLRGERRTRYIQVTLDGINPDQFPYLPSLPDTLEATIREQREKASIEFHNAVVNGEIAIAEAKEAIVEDWDQLAKRARRYRIDMADELTTSDSALRIDQATTTASGITHITLKSLDHWSRKAYGIVILDDEPVVIESRPPPSTPLEKKPPRTKMRDQEEAIVAEIKRQNHEPTELPAFISGKSWVKTEIKDALSNSDLFLAQTSFDKAWERLRASGEIIEAPPHK